MMKRNVCWKHYMEKGSNHAREYSAVWPNNIWNWDKSTFLCETWPWPIFVEVMHHPFFLHLLISCEKQIKREKEKDKKKKGKGEMMGDNPWPRDLLNGEGKPYKKVKRMESSLSLSLWLQEEIGRKRIEEEREKELSWRKSSHEAKMEKKLPL